LGLNGIHLGDLWERVPERPQNGLSSQMALVEGRVDIGQQLIPKMDEGRKLLANFWAKSPRFTTFAVVVSMGSKKWHESSDLISSNNKFIIWSIVEETWYI